MKKAYVAPTLLKVGELPKYTAATLKKISGDYPHEYPKEEAAQ